MPNVSDQDAVTLTASNRPSIARPDSLSLDDEFLGAPAPSNNSSAASPQGNASNGEQVVEIDDVTVDELREIVSERRATKAAESFVVDHQNDYAPIPANYERLQAYLDANSLEFNRQNLEVAFEATKGDLQKPGTRQTAAPRKPAQSGISDSASHGPEPVPTAEQIEQHARTIPLDQLRREIQARAFAAGKFGPRSARFSHTLESADENI